MLEVTCCQVRPDAVMTLFLCQLNADTDKFKGTNL